jgi:3,4-dihydroxy 2-butanone 4-phosphate synthase/GTP cyclohydrolase II
MKPMLPSSPLYTWLEESSTRLHHATYPLVTLSYAQSLDGSISQQRGKPLALSGAESMRMTHLLRASHDAILVGIGTIEADDPQLTVRLIEGESPTPVILDSHLRTAVQARIFQNLKQPIIACLEEEVGSEKAKALAQAGAVILPIHKDDGHISLVDLLNALHQLGNNSVMVEGGATVISAFLQQGLVDRVVLTFAPVFVGGLKAVENPLGINAIEYPRLKNPGIESSGDDFVIFGELNR